MKGGTGLRLRSMVLATSNQLRSPSGAVSSPMREIGEGPYTKLPTHLLAPGGAWRARGTSGRQRPRPIFPAKAAQQLRRQAIAVQPATEPSGSSFAPTQDLRMGKSVGSSLARPGLPKSTRKGLNGNLKCSGGSFRQSSGRAYL